MLGIYVKKSTWVDMGNKSKTLKAKDAQCHFGLGFFFSLVLKNVLYCLKLIHIFPIEWGHIIKQAGYWHDFPLENFIRQQDHRANSSCPPKSPLVREFTQLHLTLCCQNNPPKTKPALSFLPYCFSIRSSLLRTNKYNQILLTLLSHYHHGLRFEATWHCFTKGPTYG